ncbi:copper resistance CopC family protein [Actinoallomurus acaciae]|uniref:Copper resistance protein CopC n=1 Tax=Actinoallomurus acaciae TaxID=502577 RepID=A0ABV5YZP0_9ACTN
MTGWAGTASAHAHLVSSTPKHTATVAGPVTEVTLRFNEPINPAVVQVKVTGPDGRDHTDGRPRIDGAALTQGLKNDMGAGRYAIAFRVVSHDGHPVSEQLHFTLNAPGSSSTPAPPAAARPNPRRRRPGMAGVASSAGRWPSSRSPRCCSACAGVALADVPGSPVNAMGAPASRGGARLVSGGRRR